MENKDLLTYIYFGAGYKDAHMEIIPKTLESFLKYSKELFGEEYDEKTIEGFFAFYEFGYAMGQEASNLYKEALTFKANLN